MTRRRSDVPDRWLDYKAMGTAIPGTRFMACKVPLKLALQSKVPADERFCVNDLINAHPNLGLVIDLTNTDRYYSKQEVLDKDVKYAKIFTAGRVIPSTRIYNKFAGIVDRYLKENQDSDTIIAVHCTHGINRTGYFICRYMIEKLQMSPEEAVKNFELARGYTIERENYVSDLKNGCEGGSDTFYTSRGKINWRNLKIDAKKEKELGLTRPDGRPVNPPRRPVEPMRYVRSRDGRQNGPRSQFAVDRRYPNEDGSMLIPGSWRDEQRQYQSVNFDPRVTSHQRIPNPQQFRPRGPPPHPMGSPHQPSHVRAPNLFSPQSQTTVRPCFFPRFQNYPPSQPPPHCRPVPAPGSTPTFNFPSESLQTTPTPGGLNKIYSPQNRFPEPFTCNPRPRDPRDTHACNTSQEEQLLSRSKKWIVQQRTEARKQKNKLKAASQSSRLNVNLKA